MANKQNKKISSRKQLRMEKRALRQAKAQRKKFVPKNQRPIVCPTDRGGRGLVTRVTGLVCRGLVIFAAVFGLTFFMCDALRLEAQELSVPANLLALASFVAVALFCVMSYSKYGLLGGGAVIVGGVVAFVIFAGDVADFFIKTVATAKNVVLTRLFKIGYYGVQSHITEISYGSGRNAEFYLRAAFVIVATVLALIFVLSCFKRVRVLIPAVVSAAIIGVIFTYNISRSNWGVALIIAAFMGLIVMSAYDKWFCSTDNEDVDRETVLFADEARPELPQGFLTPAAARLIRKQKRREFRELKKSNKKQKKELTVEQELADYFGSSVKAVKLKPEKEQKLDPAQRKALKAERREQDRQVRLVQNYDRTIAHSRAAHGGFAAVGAFVLAMIMLLLPAATVTGSFSTIELIDEKMEEYREYVTAWLMGDDPILDDLGYKNDRSNFTPHTTDASPRYYTGEKLMTVESINNYNAYLRGWIGVDYADGAWQAVDDNAFDAYRALYGTTVDPNELLFNYFYSAMAPSVVESVDFSTRQNAKSRYGVIATQLNIDRLETEDPLVYMPAFYRVDDEIRALRADSHGLYKYGTSELLDDVTFVNYFDGLYTGRKFMDEIEYAAVAYLTTMQNEDWYENAAELIAAFNVGYNDAKKAIKKYAERVLNGRSASLDDIVKDMFVEAPEELIAAFTNPDGNKVLLVQYEHGQVEYVYDMNTGEQISTRIAHLTEYPTIDPETGEETTYTIAFAPPSLSLAIRFRETMTDADKRDLAYICYWQYLYEDFVYDTYSDKADSRVIKDMLADIIKENSYVTDRTFNEETGDYVYTEYFAEDRFDLADDRTSSAVETYLQRHELVMAIVNYLQKNYTYTLTPSVPVNEALDGVENFLSVTKEGYCVQYASALALMLRQAGIPARYVEGYVACDFRRNYDSEAVSKYVTTVRDYNEHAWVEVWYDGIGWVQYEATPVYYNDMYVKSSGSSGSTVRPWYDPEDATTREEELLESLASSIDFAAMMIESIRDEVKLMAGAGNIRTALDSLETRLEEYRGYLKEKTEFYEANKSVQGYDYASFITIMEMLEDSFNRDITEPLNLQLTLLDAIIAFNTTLRIVVLVLAVIAVLIALVVIMDKKAKRAVGRRMDYVKQMADGAVPDEQQRDAAGQLSGFISELLEAYGSAPHAGEFRDEYAARLQKEYLDVFGKAELQGLQSPDAHVELVSDTDFGAIFEALAAEEFGNGMTEDQLCEVAAFYIRLQSAAKSRVFWGKRIFCHFIKRMI